MNEQLSEMLTLRSVGLLKRRLSSVPDDYVLAIEKQDGSSLHVLKALEPEKPEHFIRASVEVYSQFL